MVKKKEIPFGVKVISVYHYILAGVSLIPVIFAFFEFAFDNSPESIDAVFPFLFLLFFGIPLVGLAVLCFFIGRDFLKLKPWAKNAAIAVDAIALYFLIKSFFLFYNSVVYRIIQFLIFVILLVVLFYLLLSKSVKKAFS